PRRAAVAQSSCCSSLSLTSTLPNLSSTRHVEGRHLMAHGLPEPPELGASALPAGTFDGQTVFVTGAGTGLGRAIASEFSRLGAAIVIASRKPEHLEQIAAAFDAAEQAFGLPSVLVNNAAANFPVPAEDMSPNAWRTVVDITLNGTFFCAREFARRHLAAGSTASIINVGA